MTEDEYLKKIRRMYRALVYAAYCEGYRRGCGEPNAYYLEEAWEKSKTRAVMEGKNDE